MDKLNLTDALKKLEEINDWFENQEEIDVEAGLEKVKEGVKLVKASQTRLQEIQNEFEEIKKDMVKVGTQENDAPEALVGEDEEDDEINEAPF